MLAPYMIKPPISTNSRAFHIAGMRCVEARSTSRLSLKKKHLTGELEERLYAAVRHRCECGLKIDGAGDGGKLKCDAEGRGCLLSLYEHTLHRLLAVRLGVPKHAYPGERREEFLEVAQPLRDEFGPEERVASDVRFGRSIVFY